MQNKLLVIINTGLPGFFKLLSLLSIGYFYNEEVLGFYVNDIAFAFTLSLLTGIGWGALLLKITPSLNSYRSLQYLLLLSMYSLLTFFIVLPFLYLAYKLEYLLNFESTIFLLFTLSIYFVVRHYLLAKREYFKLFFLELSVLFIFYILFFVFPKAENLISITAISFIMPTILLLFYGYLLFNKGYRISAPFNKREIVQGLQFSLNNFISGGVTTILPIFFMNMGGAVYAAFVGVLTNVINALLLLPRSMANYKIVSLSHSIKNNTEKLELLYFRDRMLKVNLFSMLVSLFVVLLLIVTNKSYLNLEYVLVISSLLIVTQFVNSQNVVEGNFLFLKEKQIYNIISNLFYFILFILNFFIMQYLDYSSLLILSFWLTVLSITKYQYLKIVVNNILKVLN